MGECNVILNDARCWGRTRAHCYGCGNEVCQACSRIMHWRRFGRRRVCNDCQEELRREALKRES